MSEATSPLVIQIPTESDMHKFGIRIGRTLIAGDIVSLNGPLGAGKTTLTRGIGEGLEAKGNVSSPTFLISRTHSTKSGISFNHVDAYRLSSTAELDDLDIDFANSFSVIEWGEGFVEGLSNSIFSIGIQRDLETDLRTLSISGTGRFLNPAHFLGGVN